MPESPQAGSPRRAGPDASLDERLRAVERALTETDRDLTGLADAAERTDRLEELERRCERLESRLDELEAAVDAVRGYVGAVRAVNRDVERRADAALALARDGSGEDDPSMENDPPVDEPRNVRRIPASIPREGTDDSSTGAPGPDPGADVDVGDRGSDGRTEGGPPGPDSFEQRRPDPPWTGPGERETGSEPVGESLDDQRRTGRSRSGDGNDPGGSAGPGATGAEESEPSGNPVSGGRAPGQPGDPTGSTTGPMDLGWEPVQSADGPGGSGEQTDRRDGSAERTDRQVGSTGQADRSGGSGEPTDDTGEAFEWASSTESTDRSRERDDARPSNGDPASPRGDRDANELEANPGPEGGSATDPATAGDDGFDWPPGDGIDVDRAQPWSAPDLPPAETSDEDRSLLERLREAL